MSRLVLVGGGPKSLAILAKAKVLADVGLQVPEIHLIEKNGIGAHWDGKFGHTDGWQSLGTSPEKDLGYPYSTRAWGKSVGSRINAGMLPYSWVSHLIELQEYPDWVDRGRPAPQHRQWSRYLQWAAQQTAASYHYHQASVSGLQLRGSTWSVGCGDQWLEADGVVLTGPGPVVVPAGLPQHPRLLTAESFWTRAGEILEADRPEHVAIVGSGETAAAVLLALVKRSSVKHELTIISPSGVTYSRGESFRENRLYTDPDASNWTMLTSAHRRDFIRRTDRGVFSQNATQHLDQAENLQLLAGRLMSVDIDGQDRPVLGLAYDENSWTLPCDRAILALGTDPIGLLRSWIDDDLCQHLCQVAGLEALRADSLEPAIDYHLALRNLTPRLHLPMLAGFAQGPGFPNLSSLGRVSDRILSAYVPLPEEMHE